MIATEDAETLVGCGDNPGHLTNDQVALSEISTDKQPIFVTTTQGDMVRLNLDGSGEFQVHTAKYTLKGISDDGRIAALSDSDTNLHVLQVESGAIKPIPELNGRTGTVALSADGAMIAAARHADFSTPQASWDKTEDDALYLVDTATQKVRRIEPQRKKLVARLFWSQDGTSIWADLIDNKWERFDLASSLRELNVPAPDASQLARTTGVRPTKCIDGPRAGDELVSQLDDKIASIDLVRAGSEPRPLVIVEGLDTKSPDYRNTLHHYFFSNTCQLVVFTFDGQIWVADVETGRISPLKKGRDAFALPQ